MVHVGCVQISEKKSCTCLVIKTFMHEETVKHKWMDQWWLSEVNKANRINCNRLLQNMEWS